jgi:hypothetical protein
VPVRDCRQRTFEHRQRTLSADKRGQRGASERRSFAARPHAEQHRQIHWLRHAAQHPGAERSDLAETTHQAVAGSAEANFIRRHLAWQSTGQMKRHTTGTGGPERTAQRRIRDDFAGIESAANRQTIPVEAQRLADGQSRLAGERRMTFLRPWCVEHGHDLVADCLYHGAAKPLHAIGHPLQHRLQACQRRFGIERRNQLRRSHEIDEHHGTCLSSLCVAASRGTGAAASRPAPHDPQ